MRRRHRDPGRHATAVVAPMAFCLALASCSATPTTPSPPIAIAGMSAEQARVFGSFAPHGAGIYTVLLGPGGEEIPHGLRVTTDHGWLREASVYDHGVLVRDYQFHRNGNQFLTRHIDDAGNGQMEIYDVASKPLFTGYVRGGQRHAGQFLVIEVVPGTYGRRQFLLHEYEAGALVRRSPFPFELVGVAPPDDPIDPSNWPWTTPDWPQPPFVTPGR